MTPATGVDHLIYASPSLRQGMDEIEALLGVRPVPGGRHPQYGTHNALLSLGKGTYLEIIARDPEMPLPERGALVNVPVDGDSRILTWVFRVPDIHEFSEILENLGINPGPVTTGSRQKPNGSQISWELTDPYALPMDGAIPFLINWGRTIHPSKVAPSGGQLVELHIEHPETGRIRSVLSALGAGLKVTSGERFTITAKVQTENGVVIIQ